MVLKCNFHSGGGILTLRPSTWHNVTCGVWASLNTKGCTVIVSRNTFIRCIVSGLQPKVLSSSQLYVLLQFPKQLVKQELWCPLFHVQKPAVDINSLRPSVVAPIFSKSQIHLEKGSKCYKKNCTQNRTVIPWLPRALPEYVRLS